MNCLACGKEIGAGAITCPHCGAAVYEEQYLSNERAEAGFARDSSGDRETSADIRNWHPGQLVVFWVGLLIFEAILLYVCRVLAKLQDWSVTDIWLSRSVVVVFLYAGLMVTWYWFGGRKRPFR